MISEALQRRIIELKLENWQLTQEQFVGSQLRWLYKGIIERQGKAPTPEDWAYFEERFSPRIVAAYEDITRWHPYEYPGDVLENFVEPALEVAPMVEVVAPRLVSVEQERDKALLSEAIERLDEATLMQLLDYLDALYKSRYSEADWEQDRQLTGLSPDKYQVGDYARALEYIKQEQAA